MAASSADLSQSGRTPTRRGKFATSGTDPKHETYIEYLFNVKSLCHGLLAVVKGDVPCMLQEGKPQLSG